MSKNFKYCAESTRHQAVQLATDLNYWGKRLISTKRAVVEQICAELILDDSISFSSIIDYLEASKPTATAKAKAEQAPLVPTFAGQAEHRDNDLKVLPCGRYLVTSAQNNTTPHSSFKNMLNLANEISAEVLVMPIKYTTTLEQRERKEPTYHRDFLPYLVQDNAFIGSRSGVRLAVTANILPTAKQPINTAKRLNAGEAITIVASPKAQTVTLPRPKGSAHRWAYTTRTATTRHYTESRAGDEAEQDHCFGALVVEVFDTGEIAHFEVIADEAGKLHHAVPTSQGFQPVEAMILGDLHCEKMCVESLARTVQHIKKYKPNEIILHDTLDFMSRNHHNRNSGRFLYQMGSRTVIDDLASAIRVLNMIARCESVKQVFIVASNHDDALSQWLDCPHYNADQDVLNAKTYYYLKHAILEHIDLGHDQLNVFDLACRKLADQVGELSDKIVFGHLDEQHQINGFECGQHGHLGSGGARGSQRTFRGYQMPMITGHTHSPARDFQTLTVGVTGSLEMGYNKGGSAWDRSNALIFESGQAVLCQTYLINELQY